MIKPLELSAIVLGMLSLALYLVFLGQSELKLDETWGPVREVEHRPFTNG